MTAPAPVASQETPAHARPGIEVLAQLGSSATGLSASEAAARLVRHGPNRLTERRRRGPLARFLLQFHNVLIYALLAAAAVTALLQEWIDAAVIVGVVLINAIVGFIQEGKAEKALDAIRRMLSLKAAVVRDGRLATVDAQTIVPGDVVVVQSGDRVPADLRLVRVKNLRVDEASLTGESVPVEKHPDPVAPDAALGDRTCMAYSGTFVTYGQATGVAVATGDATELGRISALLAEVEQIETPLLRKISAFGRWLTVAILLLAAGSFALGVGLRGYEPAEMFMAAVGLAVAAIPEGLPAIITITLAIGVQRMARRNAIVRRLPAVEALGSVTVICSDKTGTLTRNEMTLQSIETGADRFEVTGAGYEPRGQFLCGERAVDPAAHPALTELLRAGMLCNDAAVREESGSWVIEGDPTEAALVVAARKAGLDPHTETELRPRTDVIPFESEHRFMATLHHDHAGHGFVYLKGAPERVLELCAHERIDGVDRPIDLDAWHTRIDALARQGRRVLAIAFRAAEVGHRDLRFTDVDGGLTLLGAVGMIDPPRAEAIRAVAACHDAGIRVSMITGDHAATAVAVAAQIGIGDGRRAVTSAEIERADDARLQKIVAEVDVYARVSPEHKLRLVTALQARDEIVAMTGDGVNDAPALKRADVGVAMGVTGTEVAKEAAEIVLADDNFASIANAVEEGRTIYDNLQKTLLFIMPTNGAEALVIVGAIVAGLALPILPVQILWVNMVTAVTLALALAFEPTEPDAMRRPPRDPRAAVFPGYFIWRTLLVSGVAFAGTIGVFRWEQTSGASIELARTSAVHTLVMFEVFYLLSSRFLLAPAWPHRVLRGNPYVPLTIALVVLLQLFYTYMPFMQALFSAAPLAADDWVRIVLVAMSVYVIVEIEKWIVRTSGWRVVGREQGSGRVSWAR